MTYDDISIPNQGAVSFVSTAPVRRRMGSYPGDESFAMTFDDTDRDYF